MTIKDIEFKLKDGRTAILRSANEKDAKAFIEYMKKSTGETDFLLRTPEECETQTIEQEIDFINNCNSSDAQAMIVCEVGGKLAGNCMVWWNNRVKTGNRLAERILESGNWNKNVSRNDKNSRKQSEDIADGIGFYRGQQQGESTL